MKNANTKGMGSKASKLRARLLTSWAAVIALAASLLVTACTQNPNKNIGFIVRGGYISGYSLKNGKKPDVLVIPDGIGDTVITGLSSRIFREWYDLTKIDFSLCKHLTDIKNEAFLRCRSLTGTIVFPASLKTIGTVEKDLSTLGHRVGAFAECPKLEGADFSACTQLSVIGVETFSGCTGLKQLKLPENLTRISAYAFSGCKGLTEVKLPASLTTIDFDAFGGCTGLTKLNLPESLTKIGGSAFGGCEGLTGTIVFPKNLETIESYRAFAECPKLEGADFSACTQFSSIGEATFNGCTNLKNLKLPASLTKIDRDAFSACTSLTNITLPASLTKIGRRAFADCTGLTSVVFENKEGWAVYDNPYDTETPTPISPSDLADPSKAAKYLSETYSDKFWKRN